MIAAVLVNTPPGPDFLGVDWLDGYYDAYEPHRAPPPDPLEEWYRDDRIDRRWDDVGIRRPVVRMRWCPDDGRTYAVINQEESACR